MTVRATIHERFDWTAKNVTVRTFDADAEQTKTKGGPGSGNFGHEGRPGEVGGSTAGDGSGNATSGEPKSSTDTGSIASTVSDSGDLYSGAADDYEGLIREAATSDDAEGAEKAAYQAYEGFRAGVRENLDDFHDSVTDAAIEEFGRGHEGGDEQTLEQGISAVFDELESAAAELVDMPQEIASGDRDAGDLDEAAGKLRDLVAGMDDRLYGIAQMYLEGIKPAKE